MSQRSRGPRQQQAGQRSGVIATHPAARQSTLTGERTRPTFLDDGLVLASAAGLAAFLVTRPSGPGLAYAGLFGGLGALMYAGAGQAELQSIGAGMLASGGVYTTLRVLQKVTLPPG